MSPSEVYSPNVEAVREKIYLSKIVIEFMVSNPEASYEDLLNRLETAVPPSGLNKMTEDTLLRHAQFVCDQAHNFDQAGDDDEDMLITAPCIRAVITLAGITLGKRRALRRGAQKPKVEKVPKWTKATTTPLVRNLFESFFPEQIEAGQDPAAARRTRCDVCDVCQKPDCGACRNCKDMVKFGGSGRSKQCCLERRCPNLVVAQAEDDDSEELVGIVLEDGTAKPKLARIRRHTHRLAWSGKPTVTEGKRTYYSSVMINEEEYFANDCVMVEPDDSQTPVFIARINHMWEDGKGKKHFHADWFCRGSDTVLGETADPLELFINNDCEDCLIDAIMKKVTVQYVEPPHNWKELGGIPEPESDYPIRDHDGTAYWYKMMYQAECGRFEDVPKDIHTKVRDPHHPHYTPLPLHTTTTTTTPPHCYTPPPLHTTTTTTHHHHHYHYTPPPPLHTTTTPTTTTTHHHHHDHHHHHHYYYNHHHHHHHYYHYTAPLLFLPVQPLCARDAQPL
ncbi:DNA (cytosine-5)-methyltransferase 1 [Chionoecetes opilio]|uniref:DNA (Cytosine-5)-methyltransferase 1 n=1 Tax=Chionoecetes opilio TaxID=41210 RepID=A0A8J4YWI1_CHIOP|nr:DNA (cytosine-5)-methyltransferase 1 [Chionoecetes opilio]